MGIQGVKGQLELVVATILGPFFIKLLGHLCRYQVVGREHWERVERSGKPYIIALWHGRMLLPVFHFRGRGIAALVSRSRDGELIARVVKRLGYLPRRGSSREGGKEGFKMMLNDLKEGRTVAIFPDGPIGPRHHLKEGVIQLARLSGAPILPVSFSAQRSWIVNSWDRFTIMKPFSRAVLTIGEPLYLPRRLGELGDLGSVREMVKERLCQIEQMADQYWHTRDKTFPLPLA